MRIPERVVIRYLGSVPNGWTEVFQNHSLQLGAAPDVPALIKACDDGARAIIVPFQNSQNSASQRDFVKINNAIGEHAANRGTLVIVAVANTAMLRNDLLWLTTATTDTNAREENYVRPYIKELDSPHPAAELAELCRRHHPGPQLNKNTAFKRKGMRTIPIPGETLLSRAFLDYSKLTVSPLHGGRSIAKDVWHVTARDGNRFAATPFVVKMGPLEIVETELNNFEDMIMDSVPFPYRPPTIKDRCVSGKTQRLLVTKFIADAVELEDYILKTEPTAAVNLLFDGPLSNWRKQSRPERMQLALEYAKHWVLPSLPADLANLNAAFLGAQRIVKDILDPSAMLKALNGLPKTRVRACRAHGDLHLRNIFVRQFSGEAMLIDFARCTGQAPSTFDPSTLDVALAFDLPSGQPNFTLEALGRLYSVPLLGTKHLVSGRYKHRLAAIKQVRKRAAELVVDTREYDISVACRLLWFSRKFKNPTTYFCANRIVKDLTKK